MLKVILNLSQGDMNSSNADDKQFFLMFLQALREEFDRKSQTQRLSLSVTGAPFTEFVERGKPTLSDAPNQK